MASIGALGAFDLGSSPGRATIFLKELWCSVSETVKFRKTLSERLDTVWNSFLFSFSELMFINNSKIHSIVEPSKNLLA